MRLSKRQYRQLTRSQIPCLDQWWNRQRLYGHKPRDAGQSLHRYVSSAPATDFRGNGSRDQNLGRSLLEKVNHARLGQKNHWRGIDLALGNRALFDFMDDNSAVESYPVSYNNEPSVIARNHLMTSVNSALEIDLYGQVSAESIGWHEFSGTGGALDFMRGAFESPHGHSFLALYATAKQETVSRIVPRLTSLVTDRVWTLNMW